MQTMQAQGPKKKRKQLSPDSYMTVAREKLVLPGVDLGRFVGDIWGVGMYHYHINRVSNAKYGT